MLRILLVTLAGLLPATVTAAAVPEPAQARPLSTLAPDRILVRFAPGTAAADAALVHQRLGGRPLKTIPGIDVTLVAVPAGSVPAMVAGYAANPNVQYAEPDYHRLLVIPNEEEGPTPAGGGNYFEEQWYLHNTGQAHSYVHRTPFGAELRTTQGTADADIDAPEAWDRLGDLLGQPTAAMPAVAVLDSGADCNTLELQGKCLHKEDVVQAAELWGCTDSTACDSLGHGTFVASEIGANTDNGEGIAGAGWNVGLGIFKACYQELVTDGLSYFFVGLCPVSASAEAITRAADLGYRVINMSYGSDMIDSAGVITPTDASNAECDAVEYAWNKGVVLVAGAGNNGDSEKMYPAACARDDGASLVMAVAATDHNDDRAAFSTHGDWVSLSAPGKDIIGILPDAHCGLPSGQDSCVDWWSGTSMASPLVAAGAALVWADLHARGMVTEAEGAAPLCGDIPCQQLVRARLEQGADKSGAKAQDLLGWTRHGRLNLAGALAAEITEPEPPDPGTDQPPQAIFGYSCRKLSCSFDASASTDDHGIDQYHWTFGDGTTLTTNQPLTGHDYGGAGSYPVTLVVEDTAGQASVPALATVSVSTRGPGSSGGSADGGGEGGGDSGGETNCPPAKAAKGKC
ncbi:serine protease [Zobellella denitrificans]|uniref:S8 family peptidase n=1 Tax=Zobellella denitrificans TaxID=347534 RepID=UPI000B8BF650|nr:S8 family serine peptidase [Zobellella denitrificans]OXS15558.1 serine protease [Zobellella denitrificans]